MDTTPAYGFEACCTRIVGDMARALCERNGETPEQRLARGQAVAHLTMGFLPRDVIEVTLASHCVMFHELMLTSVHETLCAEDAKVRRAELHSLIALNKAFCGNLGFLRHYQKRSAEGSHEAQAEAVAASAAEPAAPTGPTPTGPTPTGPTPTGPTPTGPAPTGPAPTAATPVGPVQAPAGPDAMTSAAATFSATHRPTEETITGRRDHAAADAALKARDPEGFARAMGIRQPSAAFLAAANTPGSPFRPAASGPWPASTRQDKAKS